MAHPMKRFQLSAGLKSYFDPTLNLRGLRAEIIAWAFIPTALILLAVAIATFMAYRQVTEELVIRSDQEVIRLSADQLISELTEYSERLNDEARTAAIYDSKGPTDLQSALQNAGNRLVVFDGGVVVLDNFGTVVASQPLRGRNSGAELGQPLLYSRDVAFFAHGLFGHCQRWTQQQRCNCSGCAYLWFAARISRHHGRPFQD